MSDWRAAALCAAMVRDGRADPSDWFPVVVTQGRRRLGPPAEVVARCEQCPVAMACLSDAVAHHEQYGVRAGLDLGSQAARDEARRIVRASRRAA